jgi:hypothetical protein
VSVFGWRQWRLHGTQLAAKSSEPVDRLAALNPLARALWPPDSDVVAVCRRTATEWASESVCPPGAHQAPSLDSACGLYAWKTNPWPQVAPGALFVYGVVELWGTVIEHDLAWRGQIARPVALLDHPSLDPAYRCARYASWEDLVRDWSI